MAQQTTNRSRGNTSSSKKTKGKYAAKQKPRRREIGAAICLILGLIALLGVFGVTSWLTNWIHVVGKGLIGAGFYALPVSLFLSAYILFTHDGRPVRLRVFCAFLMSFCVGVFVHLIVCRDTSLQNFALARYFDGGCSGECGGVLAGLISNLLATLISKIGTYVVAILAFILSFFASHNTSIPKLIKAIRERPRLEYEEPQEEHPDPAKTAVEFVQNQAMRAERKRKNAKTIDFSVDDPVNAGADTGKKSKKTISPDVYLSEELEAQRQDMRKKATESFSRTKASAKEDAAASEAPVSEAILPEAESVLAEQTEKVTKEEVRQETIRVAQEVAASSEEKETYAFPTVDLLKESNGKTVDGTDEMRQNSARLNDVLQSFGIDAHIINVVRGPSVTRYELELERGVKLARITGLADDIALSLGASGVRISAIPDKISVVGVEVPNKQVSAVAIRDVIDSEEFRNHRSPISFAVGKDIGGNCVVGDIAKLPHMLIAGTTGSGKSVCMNSLIISLLYHATPDQVKMIMVDPKMVELGIYNEIPHLLIPVVTDPKKAAGALQWAVCEMMRRYRMMSEAGVRDLDSYNKIASAGGELETMPRIVVVIDELADLMMAAAKEVEESICRIAQMGRAAGMHLVIATQRPSADVITGLMKANIPSRIAFAVASAMESRIILDTQGAEKLVGKGDMLYAPLGQGKPKRVQGCFISDPEVSRVVNAIHKNATSDYDQKIMDEIDKNASQSGKNHGQEAEPATGGDEACDELLVPAVDAILEVGQASVSMLQRRLKLGYARAARIVDEMEERGIVGPYSGSKPRDILVTKEQWEAMKNGGTQEPVEELIE